MHISSDSVFQRNTDIVSSEFDGETVMMDTSFEKYFGMRAVGTRIWQLLESDQTLSSLCEVLTQEYEVEAEQCMQDILPFIEDLLKQEMIQVR